VALGGGASVGPTRGGHWRSPVTRGSGSRQSIGTVHPGQGPHRDYHCDSDTYVYQDGDVDTYDDPDTDGYAYGGDEAHRHVHVNLYRHADTVEHVDSDTDQHADSYTDTYEHP